MKITKRRSVKKAQSKSKKRSSKKSQSGGAGDLGCVLMYGPSNTLNIDKWGTKLILNNESRKNIIKNSISNISSKLPVEMVDEICKYIKNDETINKYHIFFKLIAENNMTSVVLKDDDYENFRIGCIVDDYDNFSEKDKDNVDKFCKKYKLEKPTFFAGFIGEIDGVNLQMLNSLFTSGTYIGEIIQYLYDQKEEIPIEQLKNHVRSPNFDIDITKANSAKISMYGKIWSRNDGKIKLNDNLRKYIIQ
jgi:hypothetical protein